MYDASDDIKTYMPYPAWLKTFSKCIDDITREWNILDDFLNLILFNTVYICKSCITDCALTCKKHGVHHSVSVEFTFADEELRIKH